MAQARRRTPVSSAPRRTEAPPWAWYSEGSAANFRRFIKKIIHWGESDAARRVGLMDLTPIVGNGEAGGLDGTKGGGYRAWWRERDGTAISAVLMAYPVSLPPPLLRDTKYDDPSETLRLAKVHPVRPPQLQQGARWVIVAAADAPSWHEEWASPLHRMLAPVPDLDWDNALPAEYAPLKLSYKTRNQLPVFLSDELAESLLNRLQEMAYTTTLLQHEPSDAAWAHSECAHTQAHIVTDADYEAEMCGLTLTLSVGDTSRETLLPALRRRGLQLPAGGFLVLPHTPLRPRYPTQLWTSADSGERPGAPRLANLLYKAVRSPALLPADVAPLLLDARADCVTHSVVLQDTPQIPAQGTESRADSGIESLKSERDDARAQLKALQEKVSDLEAALQEAAAANEKLTEELGDDAQRELREITAAALAQRDEVAEYTELLEAEVDDQIRRAAYWRGQAIAQGRPGADPPAEPDSSVPGSWVELGELLAEATEHLVFPNWDAVGQVLPAQRSWLSRTLRACQALEDYADCRVQAVKDGGELPNDLVHFAAYLTSQRRNAAIPASMWSMGEGMAVVNSARLYERRIFPVPLGVSPSGAAYMGAHLRIGNGRVWSPRMHLLDDTANTGKIIIGYVGPHLPTSLANC